MLMGVDAQLVVWSQVALLSIKGTADDECHFASRIVAFCVACFSQAFFQREAEGLLFRPLPKCLGQCPWRGTTEVRARELQRACAILRQAAGAGDVAGVQSEGGIIQFRRITLTPLD